MRKATTTPLRLATDPASWRNLDGQIDQAVQTICQYDDPAVVESFLFVIDLITNAEYDRVDRDGATMDVMRSAFKFTSEFETAQESYLNRINPNRQSMRKRA